MHKNSSVNKNNLVDGYYISYSPALAKIIGRNGAIFLSHLHYWFEQTSAGKIIDGQRFVYNTLEQWLENLDFSKKTLQRTISKLEDLGLLQVKQLAQANRTKFYAINYKALKTLMPEAKTAKNTQKQQQDKVTTPCGQNDLFNTKNTQTIHNTPTPPITPPCGTGEGQGEKEDFENDIVLAESNFTHNKPPAQPDQPPQCLAKGQGARAGFTDRLKNWKPNKQQLEREAYLKNLFDNHAKKLEQQKREQEQWAM